MCKIMLTWLFIVWLALAQVTEARQAVFTIPGDHGDLAVTMVTPDNRKEYPLVILCHGFSGSQEKPIIRELAAALERKGIATLRFDFNGHGKSQGRFQDMTVPNEIADAKKVYAYVKNLPEVTSISLAGHSQGGVVAGMLAGELTAKKIKSLVLLSPGAILREDTLRGNLFGFKFDPQQPPEYLEIFGGLKVGRDYITTAQVLPIFETSAKYRGKVCIIHGTGDALVPYTCSLHYHEIYPRSELHLLNGFDHSYTQGVQQAVAIAANFLSK